MRIRCRREFTESKVNGFEGKLQAAFSDEGERVSRDLLASIWRNAVRVPLTNHARHSAHRTVSHHANRFLSRSLQGVPTSPKKSRFSISAEMLDSAFTSPETPTPFNLIVGNGGTIDTTALWIISIIYGSYQGSYAKRPRASMKGLNLSRSMQTFNISREDVRTSLAELSDQNYRLVFSSIHDEEYFSSDGWLNQEFFLTRAGYNFASKILSNLHYIEWCLLCNDQTRVNFFGDISPDDQKELSAGQYSPGDEHEESRVSRLKQLHTLTALRSTLRAIGGTMISVEKPQVEFCLKSEKVMPYIKCITPMLQVGYNVYTESRSVTDYLAGSSQIDSSEMEAMNKELLNFKNLAWGYIEYISERSRRDDPSRDFEGMEI